MKVVADYQPCSSGFCVNIGAAPEGCQSRRRGFDANTVEREGVGDDERCACHGGNPVLEGPRALFLDSMAFWMRQGGKVEMPPDQIQFVEALVRFSFPA